MGHNMRLICALLLVLVAACTPRGELGSADPYPGATVLAVHTANARNPRSETNAFGDERVEGVRYARLEVSIPPDHQPGRIEWARNAPLASKHFAVVGRTELDGPVALANSVTRADAEGLRETVVFVHGYNTTHGEAVYSLAQMAVDFQIPAPVVLFSWQSAGDVRGYAYDRDSVLFARDDLEALLRDLTGQGRRVFLVGHSMGSALIMETLRQIAVSGNDAVLRRLNGVALLAPDIDPDLFRRQATRIGRLPQPFVIFVAEQDEVLSLSAFITGRENRLGTITDPADLGDLPVTLVDLSEFAEDEDLNHNIGTRSEAAIALMRNLTRQAVLASSIPPAIPATE